MRTIFEILKRTVSSFIEDDATTLAAALSLYIVMSLAPLMMIIVYIGSVLGDDVQERMINQMMSLAGEQASETLRSVLQNAQEQRESGIFSTIISIVTLVFVTTGVVAQLQYSMNRIWNVQSKPGQALKQWIRKRATSLFIIVSAALILIVSVVLTAGLNFAFGSGSATLLKWSSHILSVLIFTAIFAIIFKYLPDVIIAWRHVWLGAGITAVLFEIGKWAISAYLGYSSTASVYGAAGTLLIFLLWVYYESLIVFFGAELTQIYARHRGDRIQPSANAIRVEYKE